MGPWARRHAAVIAAFIVLGLSLNYVSALQVYPDKTPAEVLWRLLGFFTNLTNGIVAWCFAAMALRGRFLAPFWMGALTLWVAIICGVYYGVLYQHLNGLSWWADIAIHAVAPLAVTLWWIAYAPKHLSWHDAVVWLFWPLVYLVYALARGITSGHYPYPFIDPLRIGWGGVAIWFFGLAVLFLTAGLAMVALTEAAQRAGLRRIR
ncbi:Pr6Pr family membrane protein [Pseudooceanicola sp. LIPI14-2-Ac024]|uniref:Pr6Pr family membrane protein n=1 Tax=Pseudooceanicola sp. LIPI14-2-Ac024 TaxID=3344875 RepID=UPI0035CFA189